MIFAIIAVILIANYVVDIYNPVYMMLHTTNKIALSILSVLAFISVSVAVKVVNKTKQPGKEEGN